jgi:hypothetical protein
MRKAQESLWQQGDMPDDAQRVLSTLSHHHNILAHYHYQSSPTAM